jgi:hypothetical protein
LGKKPTLVAVARLFAISLILLIGTLVVQTKRERAAELANAREGLAGAIRREAASLSEQDRSVVSRVEPWLLSASKTDEGELFAAEIRSPEKFGTLMRRPTLYVRGPLAGFRQPAQLGDTAAESVKDSFVLCLLEPPTERTEKVLLEKASKTIAGGPAFEALTSQVHRLHDVNVVLPLLDADSLRHAEESENPLELSQLKALFDRAPIARGKAAAHAELLLYVIDEAKDPGTVTELDGASPHHARIGLVDLVAKKPLLRLRKHLDPSWVSLKRRSRYAHELDSCRLALDVREAVLTVGE